MRICANTPVVCARGSVLACLLQQSASILARKSLGLVQTLNKLCQAMVHMVAVVSFGLQASGGPFAYIDIVPAT